MSLVECAPPPRGVLGYEYMKHEHETHSYEGIPYGS